MASKREMMWINSVSPVQAGADIEEDEIISDAEMSEFGAMTVTRMIISLYLENTSATFNNIAVGVIVLPANSTTATSPNPRSDGDAPWLFRRNHFFPGSPDNEDRLCGNHGPAHIDIRSQRKIKRNEKLVLLVDDSDGAFNWGADTRVLVKLA